MTRHDAQREAQRRNAELHSAAGHRWFARDDESGDWSLMKVAGLPAGLVPAGTTTEAKPRPPMADDPRPPLWQTAGGPWIPWGL